MATVYSKYSASTVPGDAKATRKWRARMDYTVKVTATQVQVTITSYMNINRSMTSRNNWDIITKGAGQKTKSVRNLDFVYLGATTVKGSTVTYTYPRSTTKSSKTISVSVYYHGGVKAWKNKTLTVSASISIPALDSYEIAYYNGTELFETGKKYYNVTYKIPTTEPDKMGFDLKEWNTAADGSGTSYVAGSSYRTNKALKLYAQWIPNGILPKLQYDPLEDSVMQAWTTGYSVASINITSVTIDTDSSLDYIRLMVGTAYADIHGTGEINVAVGLQTGTQEIKLIVKDNGTSQREAYTVAYPLGEITLQDPLWDINFVIDDTPPDINQRGIAQIEIYAKKIGTETYDRIYGDYTVTITQDGWSVDDLRLGAEYVNNGAASIQIKYTSTVTADSPSRGAFYETTKQELYSNGLANNIFVGGCQNEAYMSRVWYSALNDPTFFPETNYVEVGANDTGVMGLVKIDTYLGVIKQSKATDTAIYLLYPVSFDDETAYAVKQSVNGIGAVGSYAFNVVGDETLFLSPEGVMAIETTEDEQHRVQNRSYYVNKRLIDEPNLESAYSFVWNGLYLLAINEHVYVLDSNQKIAWETSRSNLQYEAYLWDNIPAICFAKKDGFLYFAANNSLCRFNDRYNDDGVPVVARWSTILDSDNDITHFKTLQKKGNAVTLLADEDGTSANVYFKADTNDPVLVSELESVESEYPVDIFPRKKMKKYKRLQIIIENNKDESFGISEIVKSFTIGGYAKNR